MRIASFQSVRIKQLTGHLVKEFRVVQHFLDFLLRTTVVEQCLYLVCAYAERLGDAEQIIIAFRRILTVVAKVRVFAPPMLERGFRRECAIGYTSDAVDFQNFTFFRL